MSHILDGMYNVYHFFTEYFILCEMVFSTSHLSFCLAQLYLIEFRQFEDQLCLNASLLNQKLLNEHPYQYVAHPDNNSNLPFGISLYGSEFFL